MARNSEKAMTALARWRKAKEEEEGNGPRMRKRRPYLASECDNIGESEIFRQQVIRDISKSVTAIQNAGLGEFRIRDLNDHINKLLREKKHWENRLRELGGKSYSSKGAKMLDREGREVPGNKGYKYFGAARDLPGVRELFESDAPAVIKKTRAELMKDVDAQYYGFRDDDDGLLVPLELSAEKDAIDRLVTEWKGAKEGGENVGEDDDDLYMREVKDEEQELQEAMMAGKESTVFARVKVPTQADIEEALLRRKKQELLEMYAIDASDLDTYAALEEPEEAEEAAPVTADKAAPGIGEEAAPVTADKAAPGTADKAAPGTGEEAAPGTADEAAPGTSDEAAPGTEEAAEEPMETGAESEKEVVKKAVTKEKEAEKEKEADEEADKEEASSEPAELTIDGSPLKKMKVSELKGELEKRGLEKTGRKDELIARLAAALEEQQ